MAWGQPPDRVPPSLAPQPPRGARCPAPAPGTARRRGVAPRPPRPPRDAVRAPTRPPRAAPPPPAATSHSIPRNPRAEGVSASSGGAHARVRSKRVVSARTRHHVPRARVADPPRDRARSAACACPSVRDAVRPGLCDEGGGDNAHPRDGGQRAPLNQRRLAPAAGSQPSTGAARSAPLVVGCCGAAPPPAADRHVWAAPIGAPPPPRVPRDPGTQAGIREFPIELASLWGDNLVSALMKNPERTRSDLCLIQP